MTVDWAEVVKCKIDITCSFVTHSFSSPLSLDCDLIQNYPYMNVWLDQICSFEIKTSIYDTLLMPRGNL